LVLILKERKDGEKTSGDVRYDKALRQREKLESEIFGTI